MKTNRVYLGSAILSIGCMIFSSCTPEKKSSIENAVVENFDALRYMGTWYEIARFDFRFEKNLDSTTAQYSLNPDGTVAVVNRGYDYQKNIWKTAFGKARIKRSSTGTNRASLEVSFFGPFYSDYNVIALDSEYTCALIAGKNTKYLWILSRKPEISEQTRIAFLEKARALGYPVESLIWVSHTRGNQ